MTRRAFLAIAAAPAGPAPVTVPLRVVTDEDAHPRPDHLRHFWSTIWPEALRDFGRCRVQFETTTAKGKIWRPFAREPVVTGLERGVLNLVLTDRIPLEWDNAHGLSGVTTRYRGFQLCMIAIDRAHGHQIPLLSVNTMVHEILHALMLDIFEKRPDGVRGQAREARIDAYATRVWLLRDGAAVRESARVYVGRLRAERTSHMISPWQMIPSRWKAETPARMTQAAPI